jgi:hypothetical protein
MPNKEKVLPEFLIARLPPIKISDGNFHDSLRLKAIRFVRQNQGAEARIGHGSAWLQVSFDKKRRKKKMNQEFVTGKRSTIGSR